MAASKTAFRVARERALPARCGGSFDSVALPWSHRSDTGRLGQVTRGGFEALIRELVDDRLALAGMVAPMLRARAELLTAFNELHKMMLHQVRVDPVCRRLKTVPGVGPVTALTFRATVDVPARFARSRAVGAHFGLTPRKWQSGEIDRMGGGGSQNAATP